MTDLYVLDGREPKREPDVVAWGRWFELADRRVAFTELDDGKAISTVFLGIDHRILASGDPLLFETMAFDENGDEDRLTNICFRTSTWAQAEAMHQTAIDEIRGQP